MREQIRYSILLVSLIVLVTTVTAADIDDGESLRFAFDRDGEQAILTNISMDFVEVREDAPQPSEGYTLTLEDADGTTYYRTNFTFIEQLQGHYDGVQEYRADSTTIWTPIYEEAETVVVRGYHGEVQVRDELADYLPAYRSESGLPLYILGAVLFLIAVAVILYFSFVPED